MLSFKNRLKKRSDINNLFKKGTNIAGSFIILKFTKNNLDNSRFTFVVGSKISKKAVLRNKIKRQLRETIKREVLKIKSGFDFLIIAKSGILNGDYKELEGEIKFLFKKSKLYKQ